MKINPAFATVVMIASFAVSPISTKAQSTTAIQTTASAQITKLITDWASNSVLVQLGPNVPIVNPAGCATTDYYQVNPSNQNATLNNSALLSAYLSHATVGLVIQGCAFTGRPQIIGVGLPSM